MVIFDGDEEILPRTAVYLKEIVIVNLILSEGRQWINASEIKY